MIKSKSSTYDEKKKEFDRKIVTHNICKLVKLFQLQIRAKLSCLPHCLQFFLSKVERKFEFFFNRWLVKILCSDLAKNGLTSFSVISQ